MLLILKSKKPMTFTNIVISSCSNASCLSVVSFNSTIGGPTSSVGPNRVILVTSASDLPLCTNKFCSLLFSSAYYWCVAVSVPQRTTTTIIIFYLPMCREENKENTYSKQHNDGLPEEQDCSFQLANH